MVSAFYPTDYAALIGSVPISHALSWLGRRSWAVPASRRALG
jgi:hypothetical protein